MPLKNKELRDYRRGLLARLSAASGGLQTAAESLPQEAWHQELPGGELTPHQALARLAQMQSKMFTPGFHALLDADAGDLPVFDGAAWLGAVYRPSTDWRAALEKFNRAWQAVPTRLAGLEAADWSRQQRHPWFGCRTLQWWLERDLAEVERTLRLLQAAR